MVYEKYIKRGNKIHGPYIYKSVRDGDKVETVYVGRGKNFAIREIVNSGKKIHRLENKYNIAPKINYFHTFFLLLAVFFVIFIYTIQPTGRIIFEPSFTYKINDTITGELKLKIQHGEFIPADAVVIANLDGQEKEVFLSELLDEEIAEGNFYVKDVELSGQGRGYGVLGEKVVYPEINFVFRLVGESEESEEETAEEVEIEETEINNTGEQESEEEQADENAEEETIEETTRVEETTEETESETENAEETTSEETETENAEETTSEETETETPITGESISESEIQGIVSKNSSFIYSTDKEIEIVSVDKGNMDDLNVERGDKKIEVTTDYSEIVEGYGAEFLNNDEEIFYIDMEIFNFTAIPVTLEIKIIYNNVTIAKTSKEIHIEEETISNETVEQLSLNQSNMSIKTKNYQVVINNPVKWHKKVNVEGNLSDVSVNIPKNAENISIITGDKIISAEENAEEEEKIIREDKNSLITGNFIKNTELSEGIIAKIWRNIIKITGRVVEQPLRKEVSEKTGISEKEIEDVENIQGGSVVETANEKVIIVDEEEVPGVVFEIEENNTAEILVEYYTEGPVAIEENTSAGKRVVISADDEYNYTDILSFAEISEIYNVGQEDFIKVYWRENKSYVNFTAYDLDNNGLLDYVEWITPHLSNQTFEIILITKAEHLDNNRQFIEDVYNYVKEKDGNWTLINSGEYLRVVFERNLTREKDITIFARSAVEGEESEIEVYRQDGNDSIAKFDNITDEGWYKVYLTNLGENESYDTFDLKILNVGVEFDYVVDPQANGTGNLVYQCGTLDNEGVYIINRSITDNALTGDCIIITAKNVELDCNGSYIRSDDSYSGIYSNQINTTIRNCNVSTGGYVLFPVEGGGIGIELVKANNSHIYNTTFSSGYFGLSLSNTFYSIVENNSFPNISSSSIFSTISHYNNISGCTINSSGTYGIYLSTSSNNTIKDCNLSVNLWDVSAISNSVGNIFTNVSYSKVYMEAGTSLIKKWYYQVYVNDTGGNSLSGANVSFYDKDNTFIETIFANSSGWTNVTEIIDYINNGGTKAYYSNYTIFAYNKTYIGDIARNITYNENVLNDFITASPGTFVDPSFQVNTCKDLNYSNKVYSMTSDIHIVHSDLTSNCINITAKNITLDCAGHYISSDDGASGIYSNQTNTTIKNCNITMKDAVVGYGIWLAGANYSYIYNNTLVSSTGLYMRQSYNTSVEYNTIDSSSIGIYSGYGSNNSFIDNLISNSTYYGIYFYASDDNRLTNNNISSTQAQRGVWLERGSSNNSIANGYITTSSAQYDVYLGYMSLNNTFLNVSYDSSKEYVSGASLIRSWYYRAHVMNASYDGVPNATIHAYNTSGDLTLNTTANSSGWTNISEIMDYINVGGTRTYQSNYIMAANNETFIPSNATLWDSHNFNVTAEENELNDTFNVEIDTSNPTQSASGWAASPTSVTITWTTNEGSNSSVTYWASPAVTTGNDKFVINHAVTISGLSPETNYNYYYTSCDFVGNCRSSSSYTFSTPAQGVAYGGSAEGITCISNWKCSAWSGCINGMQTRTCYDDNNCVNPTPAPAQSKSCGQLGEDITGNPLAKIASGDCLSYWNCSEWSECLVDYTINDLTGNITFEGKQTKTCKDLNNCYAGVQIVNQSCNLFMSIEAQKKLWCNQDYVEIYDADTEGLVSRIKETELEGIRRVDIGFVVQEIESYCDYCYDKIKDYDEESVDCGGPSCKPCISFSPIKFYLWIMQVILIIAISVLFIILFFPNFSRKFYKKIEKFNFLK